MKLRVMPWLGFLALLASVSCGNAAAQPFTIALRILDERGLPVVGAEVLVSWSPDSNDSLSTDSAGRVRFKGYSPFNQAEIRVQAAGHYDSYLSLPMPYNCMGSKCQIGMIDEVTVHLKRKVNPVPMYHYSVRATSPDPSRPIGFDLERADWVKPYGNGVVTDLTYFNVCTLRNVQRFQAPLAEQAVRAAESILGANHYVAARRRIVNGRAELLPGSQSVAGTPFPEPELLNGFEIYAARRSDLDCQGEVRFDNPGDGLQFVPSAPPDQLKWTSVRSDLESDHLAPESGYQAIWAASSKDPTPSQGPWVGYLRVRSKMGPDGRIVSAWYGKVYYGNPRFARAPKLILDYYLNPDGTRNVEYDPQRNLGRDFTNKP